MTDELRTLTWRDFSAGWCPSDDDINGRKNALFKMENVELDKNGALSLAGGCVKIGSAYPTTIYDIHADDINGSRVDYAFGANGAIYRNRGSIATGGDAAISAFGTAFKYALLCSGVVRKKDVGTGTPINLGVGTPTNAPVYNSLAAFVSPPITATTYTSNIGSYSGGLYTATPAAGASAIFQSNAVTLSTPIDWSIANGGAAKFRDDDILTILITASADAADIAAVTIDILLVAPGGSINQVSDFYRVQWANDGSYTGSSLSLKFRRSDFTRFGTASLNWSNVYGERITVTAGNNAVSIGVFTTILFQGYEGSLDGTYDYMQVFVNNTGSYLALSQRSPILSSVILNMQAPNITLQNPSGVDTQVNEVWLFRRGGLLNQWYRVKVLTSSYTTPFYDELSDTDALALDITFNDKLISVQSLATIYSIVGPIEGRWLYFTGDICYPSDINNPDLVNPGIGIRVGNTNSEVFLFARKVSDGAVIIATSHDMYLLTGTFATLPDNTIDIYIRSLGCKHPAVSRDSSYDSGLVYYLAVDGWRTFSPFGQGESLVSPNTDRLYRRSETAYGYIGPITNTPGTVRFPCLISNNKLWCAITAQNRIEVFDLTRKYWRVITYGLGDVTALSSTPEGGVTAVLSTDNNQRDINIRSSLLIDGTTKQAILVQGPVLDDGLPSNRKDCFDLKVKLLTGSAENLTIDIYTDTGVTTITATNNGSTNIEQIKDNPIIVKNFQFVLSGSFSQFLLDNINIDYIPRPTQLTRLLIRPDNFGGSDFKLLRTWPGMIDTLGNTVTFTPSIDGTNQAAGSLTTTANRKTTFNYSFIVHTYGIDFGALLTGGPFEFYGMMPPVILNRLPVQGLIYHVGPIELFKYGKVSQFELRARATTTPIPYYIYANDRPIQEGNIVVSTDDLNKDTCFYIPVPKGVEGQVIKIFFGNTSNIFYPYYVRLQISRSGRDTDKEWIELPLNQNE